VVLRLASREIHTRSLQLPSPIRDARTLRTLALLDLESHPPTAAIDRVTIFIDPTPGRVLQHTLFVRAHPAPESLSTLLARLGALMGSDRIGSPVVLDTDRPGAFAMQPFQTDWSAKSSTQNPAPRTLVMSALRRCRHPVPARVTLQDGRPVRVTSDRSGFEGGGVRTCVGPWRTSGDWWSRGWNHAEWDVVLSTGVAYRIFHDRDKGGWFIDAIAD
jgi:protein ImuB